MNSQQKSSIRFRSALLCLCLALVVWAPRLALGDGPIKVAEAEGISEYRFENGLRLLLYPDVSKPKVTVNLTVLVGSRHEGSGEGGMAHLLEHMLFKGTPTHNDIPKSLKDRGATFNGTTNVDRTNYYETLPDGDENLEFAIRMEADRLINSNIRGEDLATEMTVVRNEFERAESDPRRVLQQRMTAAAYEWHNYGRPTIGNRSDIERVPLPNLRAFYRKYYQPDNVVLIIAGSFDTEHALELVTKYFGAIPRPERRLQATYTEEPAQDGERQVVLKRVGEVSIVSAAYHIPAATHPDAPVLQVLAQCMSRPPAGRLYQALVESKLATRATGIAELKHDPALMQFTATVSDGTDVASAEAALLETIENLASNPITEEEIQRAKRMNGNMWKMLMSRPQAMVMMFSTGASVGDWRVPLINRDRIQAVTTKDVARVARTYLVANNRTLGKFVPTDAGERIAIPVAPPIATVVESFQGGETVSEGERLSTNPLEIEKRIEYFQIPDGPKVAILPKKTRNNQVEFHLMLRYGGIQSLHGTAPQGVILADLMRRGTNEFDRQQLNDALDEQEALLNLTGTTQGTLSARWLTRSQYIPAVLRLVTQVLREPALAADELDLIRKSRIANLETSKTMPQLKSALQLSLAINPYEPSDVRSALTFDQRIANLENLTVDQVRGLYEKLVGGAHCQLAIVGEFDPELVKPLLVEMFAGWKAPEPYERIDHEPNMELKADREDVQIPDKDNAAYRAGVPVKLSQLSDDYPALLLAVRVFGSSGLSSRLGDRVRQQEGLSYGVSASLSAKTLDEAGLLRIQAISNPSKMDRVVEVIREELERLVEHGITEEELNEARDSFLQRRVVNYSNDSDLADLLMRNLYYDRTMQYHADFEAKLKAVTTDDVLGALRRHIDLGRFYVVTAGNFEKAATSSAQETQTKKDLAKQPRDRDSQTADANNQNGRQRVGDAARPRGGGGFGRRVNPVDAVLKDDANQDGKLSKEEAKDLVKELFDDLDADKDGFATKAELQANMRLLALARFAGTFISRLDSNSDGKVSKEEAANAAGRNPISNRFDELDTDKSGDVTAAELVKGTSQRIGTGRFRN